MNALDLIKKGSKKLKQRKIETFLIDTELLLSKALNKKREKILINLSQKVNDENISTFNELIKRRSAKEPIAYILNQKEFWSKEFDVKNTLIPRPETELMIDKLCSIYQKKSISVLDMGTGSGCILISLLSELSNSNGIGIDISLKAIKTAQINAKKHNIHNRLKFLTKSYEDLFHQKFDLVVSNPPYIKTSKLTSLDGDIKYYEPKIALDGGNDGLDLIKKVIYKAKYILKVKGMLALEIGNEQYFKVSKILLKNSFRIEYKIKDYKNNIRCLISSYSNY